MTVSVTLDKRWGGFYVNRGYSLRVCAGFVALDIFPTSIDRVLGMLVNRCRKLEGRPSIEEELLRKEG